MNRCVALRAWRMDRARCYCDTCGHNYVADTITDEQGPRSIVRGACDCTPAGRTALRDLSAWPDQEPILMDGTRRTTATAPATPAPTTTTGTATCSQNGSAP